MKKTWRRWRCRIKYGTACPHAELHNQRRRARGG